MPNDVVGAFGGILKFFESRLKVVIFQRCNLLKNTVDANMMLPNSKAPRSFFL